MPTLDDYEILETIGSGTYGTCKKVRRKKDGKVFVWKEMPYAQMTEKEKLMIVSEVNLLRELKSQHIVRYYERIVDKASSTIFIIMEYCQGGDLASVIKRHKQERLYIDEGYVWKVGLQTTLALSALHGPTKHRKSVLHRDIKPANIFLDANFDVKVGDFGLARVLKHESSFAETFVGTPYYMSPEQMTHDQYDEKSDIWSLGCVLYEMATLNPPFMGVSHFDLAKKITVGKFNRIPTYYSDELQDVINAMLSVESTKRPSINQLLEIFKRKCASNAGAKEARQEEKSSLDSSETELSEKEVRLRNWEEDVRARERALEQREKELLAKTKALVLKESHTDAQLARAQKIINSYKKRSKQADENQPPHISKKVDLNRRLVGGDTTQATLKHALLRGLAKTVEPHKLKLLNSKLASLTSGGHEWSALELVKITCGQLERHTSAKQGDNTEFQARLDKIKQNSSELKRRHLECRFHARRILAIN